VRQKLREKAVTLNCMTLQRLVADISEDVET
jgi:hypothetical protein